jgi:GH25 family lysozyme M1 (1,4-beta-N-acetylmuramidase)
MLFTLFQGVLREETVKAQDRQAYWVPVNNGLYGGRVPSLAISPTNTIYVGTHGGVFKLLNTYTLAVNVVGSGTVMLNPSGGTYNEGTQVTLTATPAAGYHFVSWSGDVPANYETYNPLTIKMDSNKTVTATFAKNSLDKGQTIRVYNTGTTGLAVRLAPSTSAEVLRRVYDGSLGKISDGPQYSDGYAWWYVVWNDGLEPGWSADAYLIDSQKVIGIDVSQWQWDNGPINWQQIYNDGYSFTFIKATEGYPNKSDVDGFKTNIQNARSAGLIAGPYHFCGAFSGSSYLDEANNFLSVAGSYLSPGSLLPALDVENFNGKQFHIGQTVSFWRTNDNPCLSVRDSPGGSLTGSECDGALGVIEEGPVWKKLYGYEYCWWRIKWSDDQDGWSADLYLIVPEINPYLHGWAPLATWVKNWCTYVKNSVGIDPILYCNRSDANDLLSADPSIQNLRIWITKPTCDPSLTPYTDTTPFNWNHWEFWQFYLPETCGNNSIMGLNGSVDLDIFNGDLTTLQNYVITSATNQPPTLSSGSVSPSSGTALTTFIYSVNYYDPEGALPTVKNVYIDGTPFTMTLSSEIASNGTYTFQKSGLSVGTHSYYFEFSDGTNPVTIPTSETYSGPTVTPQNTPPSTPQNFNAIPFASSIELTWTASTQGTYPIGGYAIYKGASLGGESSTPATTVSANTTTYTDTNVTPQTTYYYYVKAFDDQTPPNYSEPSNEISIKIGTFIITASAGSGGSISPSGTVTVNYGDSKTFTITSNSGYKISDVKVNGKSVGAVSTYTFTNVTNNHTIEAVFEKNEIVIILQIGQASFTVNGVPNTLDSPPVIKNSRTLLPIRAIIEALRGTVGWDPNTKKVTVTLGSNTIELWIGENIAKVNGVDTPIDATNSKVVPEIINSRTMLPLRFVTENLGCDVQWNGTTKTITITYPKS